MHDTIEGVHNTFKRFIGDQSRISSKSFNMQMLQLRSVVGSPITSLKVSDMQNYEGKAGNKITDSYKLDRIEKCFNVLDSCVSNFGSIPLPIFKDIYSKLEQVMVHSTDFLVTNEKAEKIIKDLNSTKKKLARDERRKTDANAIIKSINNTNVTIHGNLANISKSGLMLILKGGTQISTGDMIGIILTNVPSTQGIVLCSVVWVQIDENNVYVGVSFVGLSNQTQIAIKSYVEKPQQDS